MERTPNRRRDRGMQNAESVSKKNQSVRGRRPCVAWHARLWYSQPYSDFRVPAARLSVILYVIVCILV
eukprot:COSAG02_NODE_1749_length_11069_cov_88.967274_11_plen_68_part_00